MNLEEKPPFDTPFAWIGGEGVVRALADRFYDLMDMEPGFKALRDAHGSSLDGARDKLFWFLCGWLGGPRSRTKAFHDLNKTESQIHTSGCAWCS